MKDRDNLAYIQARARLLKLGKDKIVSRYTDLCHAMQSGVAAKMNYDSKDTDPKHLRVGINSALCDQTALAHLLMKKGIITEAEYMQAIEEEMAAEVSRYETWLNTHLGADGRISLK